MKKKSNTLSNLIIWGGIAIVATVALVALAGCTSITEHDYQFSTTSRIFGLRVVTTTQPNNTPEVDLGFVSTTVFLNPTSTNGINAARYMNSIETKSTVNPFDTSISEHIGAGDVYLGGSNDVDKAIVPTQFSPLPRPTVPVYQTNKVYYLETNNVSK